MKALAVFGVFLVWSCATEGGGTGGATGLPNRGIAPYVHVDYDDDGDPETPGVAWVLQPSDGTQQWYGPSAAADGQALVVAWTVSSEPSSHVAIARSVDAGASWTIPTVAVSLGDVVEVVPEATGKALSSPGLLAPGAGQPWLLALAYGDGAGILLARSDDGERWALDEAPLLTASDPEVVVDAPCLVRTPSGMELFYGATLADGRQVIRRAVQVDAAPLELTRKGTVLASPSVTCLDAYGDSGPCWDSLRVAHPEVRWAIQTSDGSGYYRMWYTGYAGSRGKLGFAASSDGQNWSRLASNPVIDLSNSTQEATNVFLDGRYLLLFDDFEAVGREGISLAINDEGEPSELF